MTPEQADAAQEWAAMDGADAFLMIERHANNWAETRELMEAWKRAHVAVAVKRCAEIANKEPWAHSFQVRDRIEAEFREAFK
jgi:hypothetical protein